MQITLNIYVVHGNDAGWIAMDRSVVQRRWGGRISPVSSLGSPRKKEVSVTLESLEFGSKTLNRLIRRVAVA